MADCLFENHFLLPVDVPFYGPGGIPLAYPPAAIYITAFITLVLDVPLIFYIKYFPILWGIISLVVMYVLFNEILNNKWIACLSSALVSTSYTIYSMHINAAGIVRGPAFIFCLLGLYFSYLVFERKPDLWMYVLASLFTGLTILTHFTYALFIILSVLVFSISKNYQRFLKAAIIVAGGLLLASPWFFLMETSYGVEIFRSALNSHNTLSILTYITQPVKIIERFFANLVILGFDSPGLTFLALTGITFQIINKKWRYVLWFFMSMILISEGERFTILIGGLLLGFVFLSIYKPSLAINRTTLIAQRILLLVIFSICILNSYYTISKVLLLKPSIDNGVLELSNWIEHNTQPDDVYMAAMDENPAEWFPYMFKREPVIGYWGSEWNGKYAEENYLFFELRSCVMQSSYPCLQQIKQTNQLNPDYLITTNDTKTSKFNQQVANDPDVKLVFDNSGFFVWEYLNSEP